MNALAVKRADGDPSWREHLKDERPCALVDAGANVDAVESDRLGRIDPTAAPTVEDDVLVALGGATQSSNLDEPRSDLNRVVDCARADNV